MQSRKSRVTIRLRRTRKLSILRSGLMLVCAGGVSAQEIAPQRAKDLTERFEVVDGFRVERLLTIPKKEGSWVALTNLPGGKMAAADQYGGVYEITLNGEMTSARKLSIPLTGAHGLLWHAGALYLAINEGEGKKGEGKKGVFRAADSNGDGEFDQVEHLLDLKCGGEHGVHSLVASPDGKWIYVIAGNYTTVPKLTKSWVPEVWGEDQLLPRNPDGKGHARGLKAPGGFVLRISPDGAKRELMSTGFRNPYDMAFNEDGELFAYDADMEWDFGMPWYRPTRLCHVVPGAEFGWRNGTGKWPKYYPDSLSGVVELGPGSPTGVLSGRGAKFSAKYQRAMFCYDWTFATMYAVHLISDGEGYQGEREEFFVGAGMPLTDGVIGQDGAMYFLTGGRRVSSRFWRMTYVGDDPVEPVPVSRRVEDVAPTLESLNRVERYQARTAVELEGIDAVRAILAGSSRAKIEKSIALSRVGSKEDREMCLGILESMGWAELAAGEKLGWLRALSLLWIRQGAPDEEERLRMIGKIGGAFPTKNADLNAELCRVLCYLQDPQIVRKTLAEMLKPKEVELPDWARLISRNKRYGTDLANTLRDMPAAQDIHYAYCLRVVKGPWSEEQRRQLMEWYSREEGKKGGRSYRPFLKRMKQDTLKVATPGERKLVKSWGLEVKDSPFSNLPVITGKGHAWTVDEVVKVAKDLNGADRANGKKMFEALTCYACHRVDGRGGGSGPDLTAVGARFSPRELAVAILEPHKEVSSQYAFSEIVKKDGTVIIGRVIDEKDRVFIVAPNAYDLGQTVEVDASEIQSTQPWKSSPMPAGLINRLDEKKLKDLLGWLLKK